MLDKYQLQLFPPVMFLFIPSRQAVKQNITSRCSLSWLPTSPIFAPLTAPALLATRFRLSLPGTSLLVQWLKICLSMQKTPVQSLVGEHRPHMSWGHNQRVHTPNQQRWSATTRPDVAKISKWKNKQTKPLSVPVDNGAAFLGSGALGDTPGYYVLSICPHPQRDEWE